MSQFWSQRTHELAPYTPGEQPQDKQYIKLNTNENPYPPSPRALEAMRAAANEDMRLYPDPDATALKQAIAEYYALPHDQVFVGNSSDEVLAHTFVALLKHDKPLLFPDISYSFYPTYCRLFGINTRQIALDENFLIDPDDYRTANGGIIFPNPNAPTGIALPLEQIKSILDSNSQSPVVVDEAYVDFGAQSAVALIKDYPNLLVTQTFSKSRSLAGLRVGFALGHKDLIAGLERVKNSFNSYPLDRAAIAGASASVRDRDYFEATCKKIITTRETTTKALQKLGFKVLPSSSNFVFARPAKHQPEAEALYLGLKDKGVLVRYFKAARIRDYLRITIGTNNEMAVFLEKLTELLGEAT